MCDAFTVSARVFFVIAPTSQSTVVGSLVWHVCDEVLSAVILEARGEILIRGFRQNDSTEIRLCGGTEYLGGNLDLSCQGARVHSSFHATLCKHLYSLYISHRCVKCAPASEGGNGGGVSGGGGGGATSFFLLTTVSVISNPLKSLLPPTRPVPAPSTPPLSPLLLLLLPPLPPPPPCPSDFCGPEVAAGRN